MDDVRRCANDLCDRPAPASAKQGRYCRACAYRVWRYGDPQAPRRSTGKPPIPVETRFWPKLDRRGPDECWPWQASTNLQGYGTIHLGGRPVLAHRVAYELANGAIPDGMFICHHCDNPLCCNPAHLFVGTAADNTADMVRKGRSSSKLTPDDVRVIRLQVSAGVAQTQIAEQFGVTPTTISFVASRKTWNHVTDF